MAESDLTVSGENKNCVSVQKMRERGKSSRTSTSAGDYQKIDITTQILAFVSQCMVDTA
jgi:hypothetical protein